MNTKKNDFLGTDPIGKLILKLSFPIIIAQLINMMYNLVDRVYLGRIPNEGALALTGVGLCLPLIMIISAFAALVSMGGAPRASIFMGKKDYNTANDIVSNCFTLQIIISIILTVIFVVYNRSLLLLFGASENTIGYASSYMTIYAAGTIFVQLTLGMNAFITAQGFAKISMFTVLIGAIFNIILDPIFIFVFNLGVRGAALATIISQAASCIWVLRFLTSKKSTIRLNFRKLRLQPRIILPCIALGLAPFIMQASESVIQVCFNSSLLKYGGDLAVGAMTILTTVMQFSLLPLQGLGQGAQPIISYNYGAKNVKRVKQAFKILLISSLCYSIIIWLFITIFPRIFVMIFTTNPELIDYSSWAVRIYVGGMGIFGIQMACQMAFNAIGNAICSIIVAVMRKFILLIPLIFILPNFFADKAFAVYLAEPVADVLAVTFTAILFTIQFRKSLRKIQEI